MEEPQEKIRVSAGEDLLAFIPHMVGYWPEASVVCIGMAGKQLRATLRMDLPPEGADIDLAYFATVAATQMACDAEADGTLVAIFAAEDWTDPEHLPYVDLYDELLIAFADVGLPVQDAWCVGAHYWRSIFCANADCCPWPGKDNASIRNSFVNAEFVYRGSAVRGTPKEQIQELTAVTDSDFAKLVRDLGKDLRDPLAVAGDGGQQLVTSLGAWEYAVSKWPEPPDAALTAYLLASLGNVNVRDCVTAALATTSAHALMGAMGLGMVTADLATVLFPRNWHGGNQSASHELAVDNVLDDWERDPGSMAVAVNDFACILVGDVAARPSGREARGPRAEGPDWGRLERAEPLLQFLARATSGPDKAPILCLLGWIQWCKGSGTWAGGYIDACLKVQPDYRLAELLGNMLGRGLVAECAKNPRTAWRGGKKRESSMLEGTRQEGSRQEGAGREPEGPAAAA